MLHIPEGRLRDVQRTILTRILSKLPVASYVHAFESSKSIPVMAEMHSGKDVVVSMDIHNFFGRVTQEMIQEVLLTGVRDLAPTPARILSELITYKAYLPQGAVTSPKMSNIVVTRSFGPAIKTFVDTLAETPENGMTDLSMSIYADDITISYNGPVDSALEIVRSVKDILGGYGFSLKDPKTKIMPRTNRQWVCGVVVNERVNLSKEARDELKARVHNVQKNGLFAESRRAGYLLPDEYFKYLIGRLSWYTQVDPVKGASLKLKLMRATGVVSE